jgi:hypothetical protein
VEYSEKRDYHSGNYRYSARVACLRRYYSILVHYRGRVRSFALFQHGRYTLEKTPTEEREKNPNMDKQN